MICQASPWKTHQRMTLAPFALASARPVLRLDRSSDDLEAAIRSDLPRVRRIYIEPEAEREHPVEVDVEAQCPHAGRLVTDALE